MTQPCVVFGDFVQYDRARDELMLICRQVFSFPEDNEFERYFLLAAIRRSLSLEAAFRQAVESCNGQMAVTIIRLSLDTLARVYALYWADETEGMTAESFAKDVAKGRSIRKMRLRGSKSMATDKWLIDQIKPLASWVEPVYLRTCGAVHFSDFHIQQLYQQMKKVKDHDDGAIIAQVTIGPGEKDADPELYREVKQAFLNIFMMLNCAIEYRCK